MKYLRYLKYCWRSIPLFHAFGVPVSVHSTYLLFPFGLLAGLGWSAEGLSGLLIALGLLATVVPCILVHEFAHVLTAAWFGIPTRRVILLPVGCAALLEDIPSHAAEIVVALAGPAASVSLGLLGWAAIACTDTAESMHLAGPGFWLIQFTLFNLGVGIFNLLPCFPMDGGRVVRGILTILIGVIWKPRAATALITATRIVLRYLAWPIALGVIALTIGYTHLWHHLLIFILVPLMGELELFFLKETSQFARAPIELTFLPAVSIHRPRRQTGLRHSPWSGLITIEKTQATSLA